MEQVSTFLFVCSWGLFHFLRCLKNRILTFSKGDHVVMCHEDSTSTVQSSCAFTAHGYDCLTTQRSNADSCKACGNKLRPEKLRAMLRVGAKRPHIVHAKK